MSKYIIKLKYDTLESWLELNPILNENELVAVNVQGKVRYKKGDGITSFRKLPFISRLSELESSFTTYCNESEYAVVELHP